MSYLANVCFDRSSHLSCYADDGCDPLGAVNIDKMESLQKELDQTKQKLSRAQATIQDKDYALREKDSIITGLRREKEELRRSRSNSGASTVSQFSSLAVPSQVLALPGIWQ